MSILLIKNMVEFARRLHWSTKFNFFFFAPRTSIDELSGTFYAEFRYVYRIFLSGRILKIQRNLNVQNSTLRAHVTGSNSPLICAGVLTFAGILRQVHPSSASSNSLPTYLRSTCLGTAFP